MISIDNIRESLRLKNAGVGYALGTLVVGITILSQIKGKPNYLDSTNLSNIADQSAHIAILAIFTTVVLISGNFDLSIAANAALGAVLSIEMLNTASPTLAIVVPLLAGATFGLANGLLVQKVGINAFIVTLATLTIGRGLILLITDTRTVTTRDRRLASLQNGTWTLPNMLVIAAIAALLACFALVMLRRKREISQILVVGSGVLAVILGLLSLGVTWSPTLTRPTYYLIILTVLTSLVLRFTIVGRRLYAVGGNAEAAELSGINVDRYRIASFVLNGVAAGFVGILFAARLGAVNPDAMSGAELTAIAAAILGGTSLFGGAVIKSVCGALILFVLNNGFNILNLGSEYQDLVKGFVILAAAATYTISGRRASTRPPVDLLDLPPENSAAQHGDATATIQGAVS